MERCVNPRSEAIPYHYSSSTVESSLLLGDPAPDSAFRHAQNVVLLVEEQTQMVHCKSTAKQKHQSTSDSGDHHNDTQATSTPFSDR